MWIVHPQFVTNCQRRLAAKFQFINRLRKSNRHTTNYTIFRRRCLGGDVTKTPIFFQKYLALAQAVHPGGQLQP